MAVSRRTFVRIGVVAGGTLAIGGGGSMVATWAPEPELARERMGKGMRKVLVAYQTKSGSVTDIAKTIALNLGEGVTADVKPLADGPDPAGYDAVIVGSGVRAGNWHGTAKEWVKGHAEVLKGKPVAFFSVGMSMTDPSKSAEVIAYTDPLIAETGVKPVDVGPFAGWFEPKRFSFLERTIMKAMKAPEGDHRDLQAVATWASAVAPKLGA
jgi:menaquinone-dependent protoporphyrinogen oxidase